MEGEWHRRGEADGVLERLNLVQGLLHDGPWLHIIVHCRGSKGGGLNESPERMDKYIQVPHTDLNLASGLGNLTRINVTRPP